MGGNLLLELLKDFVGRLTPNDKKVIVWRSEVSLSKYVVYGIVALRLNELNLSGSFDFSRLQNRVIWGRT